MYYVVVGYKKIKEKLCSLNSVSPPLHSLLHILYCQRSHTTTATNITFIQSLVGQNHTTSYHAWTTLICLAHKSRLVTQFSHVPSSLSMHSRSSEKVSCSLNFAVGTWTSCGSRNGNASIEQKSFCETPTPQRHQPPSEPATKLISGQLSYSSAFYTATPSQITVRVQLKFQGRWLVCE